MIKCLRYLSLLANVCVWVSWNDHLQVLRNVSICVGSHGSCGVQLAPDVIGYVMVVLYFNGVVTEIDGYLALWISSAVAMLCRVNGGW